jgi:hypothetical protein
MQAEPSFRNRLTIRIPAVLVFLLVWVFSYLLLSKISSETRSLSNADQMRLGHWAVGLASRGVTEVVMAVFAISALSLRYSKTRREAATWWLVGLLLVYTALSCGFQINSAIRAFSFSF